MISGYIKSGLATLSGFHDGKIYSSRGATRQDFTDLTSWLTFQLSYLSADPGMSSVAAQKRKELSNASTILQHWPADDLPGSPDSIQGSQWSWQVDAIDAIDIIDKLSARLLLAQMTQYSEAPTSALLSGEMHWLNAWQQVTASFWRYTGQGELSDLKNYEILSGFTDIVNADNVINPQSRPPVTLSGVPPYHELQPWLRNAAGDFPRKAAQQMSLLNSSTLHWQYDLGVSTQVSSVQRSCVQVEDGKPIGIKSQQVALSSQQLSAEDYLSAQWSKLTIDQTIWLNKNMWSTLSSISGNQDNVVIGFTNTYGTSDLPDRNQSYPTIPPHTILPVELSVEPIFAPVNFLPWGNSNYRPIQSQMADLEPTARACLMKQMSGQDIYSMMYSINDCAVMGRMIGMATPGNLCSTTNVWNMRTATHDVYDKGYDPLDTACLPRPYLGYIIGQYTFLDMKVHQWVDESDITQGSEVIRTIVDGTPLVRDISAVVWHKGLEEVCGQPEGWFIVPVFTMQGIYNRGSFIQNPQDRVDNVEFADQGLKSTDVVFFVRGDQFWAKKQGSSIVEDPDGDILCIRTGDVYKAALSRGLQYVKQRLPEQAPDPPDPWPPQAGTLESCMGFGIDYINVFGPAYAVVWFPWKGRFQLADLQVPATYEKM